MCVHSCATVYMWNSEELVLSFYPVDLEDGPLVIRVSRRYLYPMSHLEPLFLAIFFQFLSFLSTHMQLLVFQFVEAVSQTLATVMSITVASYENPSTTFIRGTLDKSN